MRLSRDSETTISPPERVRDLAADEAGIAALRHDRRGRVCIGEPEDGGHLRDAAGPKHQRRAPTEFGPRLDQVRRDRTRRRGARERAPTMAAKRSMRSAGRAGALASMAGNLDQSRRNGFRISPSGPAGDAGGMSTRVEAGACVRLDTGRHEVGRSRPAAQPSGLATCQTPPTPSPVTSPGLVSFTQR